MLTCGYSISYSLMVLDVEAMKNFVICRTFCFYSQGSLLKNCQVREKKFRIYLSESWWKEEHFITRRVVLRDIHILNLPTVSIKIMQVGGSSVLTLTLFRMAKSPPTSFSPVTSANVGIRPQNFLTFIFNPFATLVSDFKFVPSASLKLLKLNQDHLSNPYKNWDCDNFSHRNAIVTKLWSHDYINNIIGVTG